MRVDEAVVRKIAAAAGGEVAVTSREDLLSYLGAEDTGASDERAEKYRGPCGGSGI